MIQILDQKIVVFDGNGFSGDHADRYYLKIRGYNVKHYFKYGWYRRLNQKIFKKEICSGRNNVKSVFNRIKRKFSEINKNKTIQLQNKKEDLKH